MKRFLFPRNSLLQETKGALDFWYHLIKRPQLNMREERHAYGTCWRQYFLLFTPKENKSISDKIILYFHGGGWALGKPEWFRTHAQQLVNQGYTVIMPSHRRIPKFSYVDMREDLNLLVQQLKKTLAVHQLENKKIIVGGVSSGGTLAGHLFYDRKALKDPRWASNRFAALFTLAAPLALQQMKSTPVIKAYVGGKKEEHWRAASPITYLSATETRPMLCIHGEKDGIVNYRSSVVFVEKLKQHQTDNITFYTIKNGTHLDASRWGYQKDEVYSCLFNWLREIE